MNSESGQRSEFSPRVRPGSEPPEHDSQRRCPSGPPGLRGAMFRHARKNAVRNSRFRVSPRQPASSPRRARVGFFPRARNTQGRSPFSRQSGSTRVVQGLERLGASRPAAVCASSIRSMAIVCRRRDSPRAVVRHLCGGAVARGLRKRRRTPFSILRSSHRQRPAERSEAGVMSEEALRASRHSRFPAVATDGHHRRDSSSSTKARPARVEGKRVRG